MNWRLVSRLVFRIDELLAYYYCHEFYRLRNEVNASEEDKVLNREDLVAYMDMLHNVCNKNLWDNEPYFFGGDDEDSQVLLYSKSLSVFVNCFAVRVVSGLVEPIFFLKSLPKNIKDNHLLSICVALQALRDLGVKADRAWLTTGTEHLSVEPPVENFEIIQRISSWLAKGEYSVKVTGKCNFCPLKGNCEVYDNIERVKSLCVNGPSRFLF